MFNKIHLIIQRCICSRLGKAGDAVLLFQPLQKCPVHGYLALQCSIFGVFSVILLYKIPLRVLLEHPLEFLNTRCYAVPYREIHALDKFYSGTNYSAQAVSSMLMSQQFSPSKKGRGNLLICT